jgi:hypothetical protein
MHHSPVATLHKTGRTIFTALKFLPAWLKFLIATTPMIAITARVPHTRTKIQNFQVISTNRQSQEMSSSPFLQWLLVGLIILSRGLLSLIAIADSLSVNQEPIAKSRSQTIETFGCRKVLGGKPENVAVCEHYIGPP